MRTYLGLWLAGDAAVILSLWGGDAGWIFISVTFFLLWSAIGVFHWVEEAVER